MGMSIDEAISNLEQMTTRFNYRYGTNKMVNVVVYGDDIQTFDFVIDSMRKYQKIKEIVEHWACCGNPSDSMIAISEVLEDGKID